MYKSRRVPFSLFVNIPLTTPRINFRISECHHRFSIDLIVIFSAKNGKLFLDHTDPLNTLLPQIPHCRNKEVCSDVEVEPPLLPLTGEKLPKAKGSWCSVRCDVSARNLWSPLAKALIDIRLFNPQAKPSGKRVFLKCTRVTRKKKSKNPSHELCRSRNEPLP